MSDIIITREKIPQNQLVASCKAWFGDMVKIVVDIERQIVGIGGDLHADAEELLVQAGSEQSNIWGCNLYPWNDPEARLEYTALINIRPHLDNPSMQIMNEEVKRKVAKIVHKLVLSSDEKLV